MSCSSSSSVYSGTATRTLRVCLLLPPRHSGGVFSSRSTVAPRSLAARAAQRAAFPPPTTSTSTRPMAPRQRPPRDLSREGEASLPHLLGEVTRSAGGGAPTGSPSGIGHLQLDHRPRLRHDHMRAEALDDR